MVNIGEVSVFAGNGENLFLDGIGTLAAIYSPYAVFVDTLGSVYTADGDNQIREILSSG